MAKRRADLDLLLAQAKRLSEDDLFELLRRLEDFMVLPKRRLGAGRARRPYALTLAAAGTFHSDYTDVSRDKYKHLGEAYATRRGA